MMPRGFEARCTFASAILAGAILSLALAAAVASPVAAQATKTDPATAAPEYVIAAMPRHWPPQYDVDEKGKPLGFAIDIMGEIAKRAGFEVRYLVAESFLEAVKWLNEGKADLIPNSGIVPERAKTSSFTSPLETFVISIFVRSNTQDIRGVEDLVGRSLAVVERNVGLFMFGKREDIDVHVFKDVRSALFDLMAGRVDALVYPAPVLTYLARKSGIEDRIKTVGPPLREVKRGIRVRKGDDVLLAILNKAVEGFIGTPEYQRIYTKWYGVPVPFWTAARVAWVMGGVVALLLVSMAWWRYQTGARMIRVLSQSEARFRDIAETASDWFWEMDENLLFTYHSPRYFEITGFRPEDKIGTARTQYVDASELKMDAEKWAAHMADLEARRPFTGFEYEFRTKSGRTVSARISGMPVFDADGAFRGYRGSGTDITERKKTERALELIRFALDNAGDAALGLDREGRVVYANNTSCDLLGYSHEEILGLAVTDYDHNASIEDFERAWERVRTTGPYVFEATYSTKGGESVPVEVSLCFVDFGGEELVIGLSRDISERKATEEALLDALKEAETANSAKSEFLANMSHELRTPLNSIIGFSDLIRGQTFGRLGDGRYLEYASNINISGYHLLSIISDLLDVSKIEVGALELVDEEIDVGEMITSSVGMIDERAAEAGVKVATRMDSDLPNLRGDMLRLRQMLLNLLSNAVKFTPAGGKITVTGSRGESGAIALTVEDTGVGMISDDLGEITKPFVQLGSSLTRNQDGTGLGLTIVSSLAEMHGGELTFTSQPGKGTAATIRFPAERTIR